MAASVLFDAPGPKARARYRLYTILSAVMLSAVLAWMLWRLWQKGQFEYELWEPLVTPRILEALLEGLLATLTMAVVAVAGAIVIGALLGVAKVSEHRLVSWPAWAWVEFFRAVPLLMLIVAIWYYFGAKPEHGFEAAVIGLWLYNGAVLAEIFRAGLNAVPRGQAEAAYSMGMRKTLVMNAILLPQAVKIMIPAIISQSVVALKDTTLGYAVLSAGIVKIGGEVALEFRNPIQTYLVIAAVFIIFNLALAWLANWMQRRYAGEKKIDVTQIAAMGKGDGTAA